MKSLYLALALTAATTLLSGTNVFADDKTGDMKTAEGETTVAFRTGTASIRYVTAAPQGGLNTKSAKIGGPQMFVLIDLNGGDLADGDSVQIKWAPGEKKPTYWHEGEGTVNRIGGKPNAACTFKLKFKAKTNADAPQSIVLQTASGKFVSAPSRDAALAATQPQDEAAILEIIENPKAEATQ